MPIMAQHWMLAWQLCDFQGIHTRIAKKPYIFVIFLGGSGPPVPPSGSAHDLLIFLMRTDELDMMNTL